MTKGGGVVVVVVVVVVGGPSYPNYYDKGVCVCGGAYPPFPHHCRRSQQQMLSHSNTTCILYLGENVTHTSNKLSEQLY